jgi:hypothetical protein
MKIELDLNPIEASVIEQALDLYMNQVERTWSGAIKQHFTEQKEKAMEEEYPHLLQKNFDMYRSYVLDARQSGAKDILKFDEWHKIRNGESL